MSETQTLRPASAADVRDILSDAAMQGRALEPRGGGSKRDIGKPDRKTAILDLGALRGIVDYAPSELVLTARPATPLAEIEELLAENGQMLAFEPWDHGALLGNATGAATIGGIVAAGVSGPRRVSAGGARDHLLGFHAVSGRGEIFKGGGKVVKNVTGFDLSKAIAGSWGQLAVMTELTLKVLPRPRQTATVALHGLGVDAAVAAMAQAMGSPCAVAAAAHVPAQGETPATTVFRLEGFAASVEARIAALARTLADFGTTAPLDHDEAGRAWSAICTGAPVNHCETVWRVHLAPSQAPALAAAITGQGGAAVLDWAGAALWIGAASDCDVRGIAQRHDGHAMLVRAPASIRAATPARLDAQPAVAALTARLRQAFDPAGILDPHRFA